MSYTKAIDTKLTAIQCIFVVISDPKLYLHWTKNVVNADQNAYTPWSVALRNHSYMTILLGGLLCRILPKPVKKFGEQGYNFRSHPS